MELCFSLYWLHSTVALIDTTLNSCYQTDRKYGVFTPVLGSLKRVFFRYTFFPYSHPGDPCFT